MTESPWEERSSVTAHFVTSKSRLPSGTDKKENIFVDDFNSLFTLRFSLFSWKCLLSHWGEKKTSIDFAVKSVELLFYYMYYDVTIHSRSSKMIAREEARAALTGSRSIPTYCSVLCGDPVPIVRDKIMHFHEHNPVVRESHRETMGIL